ncbi:hypothetical protein EYC80_006392 [Monilinia laxa]|uniref:C2H2-type domain-containing protein n=1 Tax=Monilinia laxa TaxID=61186 RepID=A0A5N6JRT5_MONLA|nr:hypothetical protein EYC80_006392 [Monilinia laxa]
MDMSNMVPSLDQTTTSAGLGRAIVAPPNMPTNSFGNSFNMMNSHQHMPQNSYGFTSYTDGASTTLIPTYGASYIHPRPLPRVMQTFSNSPKEAIFNGGNHQGGFIESIPQSQSPPIKPESQWATPINRRSPSTRALATPPPSKDASLPPTSSDEAHIGSTAVDRLMKIIQDKTQTLQLQSQLPSITQSTPMAQDESRRLKTVKKKYRCTFENCPSSFPQKTHLDIHLRKHTGAKPFTCKYQSCGRSFSQQGNLKTHMDRHSGERRFPCEICGKRFGQRSNLSAHRIVHTGAKPFPCKLDGCDKHFTQLGNLKSHHNKFHRQTIENLEAKLQSGEIDLEANKEFWSYFFTLYKNSNKGIKGRGKDRNISPRSRSLKTSHASTGSNASRYISSSSAMRSCHGLMGVDVPSSFNSDVTMYDSDASMRSRASGSMSVDSNFSSATTDGTASTCSSFTEEIAGDYKGNHSGVRGGLPFGDRLY